MFKKLIIVVMFVVGSFVCLPANNVAHAKEVFMGTFQGTDYYIVTAFMATEKNFPSV